MSLINYDEEQTQDVKNTVLQGSFLPVTALAHLDKFPINSFVFDE